MESIRNPSGTKHTVIMHIKHYKKCSTTLHTMLKIVMWVKDCNILYTALSLAAAVASSSCILWSGCDLQCQRYQRKGLLCNIGENRSPEQLYWRTLITKRAHSALHGHV